MFEELSYLVGLLKKYRTADDVSRYARRLLRAIYPATLPLTLREVQQCSVLATSGFYVVKPVRYSAVAQIVASCGSVPYSTLRLMGAAAGIWGGLPPSRTVSALCRSGVLSQSDGVVELGPAVRGIMPTPADVLAPAGQQSAVQLVLRYIESRDAVGLAAAAYATHAASGVPSRRWRSQVGEALRRLAASGQLVEESSRPITRYRKATAGQPSARHRGDSVALPDRYRLGRFVAINYQAVGPSGIDEDFVARTPARALLAFPVVLLRPDGRPVTNPVTGRPFEFESLTEVRDEIATMQALAEEDD